MTASQPGGVRLQHDRQHAIYMLALREGSVDVANLARRYGVTTETIRRDLSDMQQRQLLRRVHGGAVPVERMNHEPMVDARDVVNAEEKLRIATKAVDEVPDRGSVIIDSGSTGHRLAQVFPVERDIHVVTNSRFAADFERWAERRGGNMTVHDDGTVSNDDRLGAIGDIAFVLDRTGTDDDLLVVAGDMTVLGGAVRTKRLAMVDDTTRTELDHIAVDVLFISCDGLSFKHGLTTPYREEYTLKRAMIERTQRVVALVDSSKFGNMQMFSFASFDEIDVLVTDTGADPEAVDFLSTHGITVHRA